MKAVGILGLILILLLVEGCSHTESVYQPPTKGKEIVTQSEQVAEELTTTVPSKTEYAPIFQDGFAFFYDYDLEGYVFYSLDKEVTAVTIPPEVGGVNVVAIGEKAFNDHFKLKEIVIPNTIKKIEDSIFLNCYSLESVVIPESVTEVGVAIFDGCVSLNSVVIPDHIDISNGFYAGCKSLTTIAIPDGTTSLNAAFLFCTNLESVTIPESVTKISNSSFCACYKLESVILPSYLTEIEYCTFRYCTSLKEIHIPKSVKSIGISAFEYCEKLETIYYASTKADWNKITKATDWNKNAGDYEVICTDGIIR